MPFSQLHVTEERLDAHCRLLRRYCTPVTLDQVRRAGPAHAALPRNPVLVTFDDGYRSFVTRALPILERHQVPAVLFACAGPIAGQQMLWYDAVAQADSEAAAEHVKYLPFDEWRRATAAATTAARPGDPHAPMTIDELRSLAGHPLVSIGGHTLTHPILKQAPLAVQRTEIAGCRELLSEWTGQPLSAFAYPNGQPGRDYSPDTVRLVEAAGFELAFTTAPRINDRHQPFEIPRFVMLQSVTAAELAHRLAISWRSAA